jgi:hypothetical protein
MRRARLSIISTDTSAFFSAAFTRRKTTMAQITRLACACGSVQLEVERAPIISTECHCGSCRSAGAKLQALPEAPAFMETNGGTRFVLYRKDRIRFHKGAEALKEFRLTPGRRYVLQYASFSRVPQWPLAQPLCLHVAGRFGACARPAHDDGRPSGRRHACQ